MWFRELNASGSDLVSSDIHYEVLADVGQGWKVQCVLDDREAARERALEIFEELKPLAIKTIRSGYDARKGEYVETEIGYLGERKPGGRAPSEVMAGANICQSVEDFYRGSSRRTIRKHLRQWLEGTKLTPIELLHHADFVNKLENSGTMLQGAIQRTAMEHAKATGESVHEHQKVLFDLFDKGAARLRLLWRDKKRPQMKKDDPDELLRRLTDTPDEYFLFNTALTDWLQKFKKPQDKIDGLIGLLSKAGNPKVVTLLDNYMTDFVEDPAFMQLLLGEDGNFGNAVLKAVSLVAPQNDEEADVPQKYKGFVTMMQRGKLPTCRNSLIRRLASSIASQRPFRDGHPMNEARFAARLRGMLSDGGREFLGSLDIEKAFYARSERLISPTAIGRLTEDLDEAPDRLNAMLDLEPAVCGDDNKRKLGEFILALLEQQPNQKELSSLGGTPLQRMRGLAELQLRLKRTGLPNAQRKKATELIDFCCASILDREKVLDRLVAKSDPVSACMALLQLCDSNSLTEGKAIAIARYHIVNALKAPNFLEDFLAGIDDKTQQKKMLVELQTAISKARVSTGSIAMPGAG
jgi:hypothetical protein